MNKLGEVYTYLKSKMKFLWNLGEWVTIDEGMIPFKGKIN